MKKKKNAALTVPNTRAQIRYRLVFQWHIISGEGFAFAFGVFAHYIADRLPELNSTERDKNTCCNAMLFPGNLDLSS